MVCIRHKTNPANADSFYSKFIYLFSDNISITGHCVSININKYGIKCHLSYHIKDNIVIWSPDRDIYRPTHSHQVAMFIIHSAHNARHTTLLIFILHMTFSYLSWYIWAFVTHHTLQLPVIKWKWLTLFWFNIKSTAIYLVKNAITAYTQKCYVQKKKM